MKFEFSEKEFATRRDQILNLADDSGCTGVFTFGENRNGTAITWLSGWGTTRLAYHFLSRYESILWILFHNHIPAAERTVKNMQIRDFEFSDIELLVKKFANSKIGTLGVVPQDFRNIAYSNSVELIALDAKAANLRMIKSEEEIAALRLGAYATDCGAEAIISACRNEVTDWELLARARSSYTTKGARDHICYICISDMTTPDRDVPAQFPEGRIVKYGSIVTFEISAAFSPEYPGQVLRSVSIGKPHQLFQELHDVAQMTLTKMREILKPGINAMELVEASSLIEEAGFTTTDDLFHGLGGGYLQPIGTSSSRVPRHEPDIVLKPGMAIVLQPNVTTRNHLAGVQTGEMVIITDEGFEDIHHVARGLIQIDQ
ncbi:MAG TPA: M24 family metallopeptidase [archaeon]|nr:M24 family metallopeptidase [archaeon]